MTLEKINQTISELIDTVICGNKVKGNETYEKMAKSVTFVEIKHYFNDHGMELIGAFWAPVGRFQVQPKNLHGETLNKVDFFDKIIKGAF